MKKMEVELGRAHTSAEAQKSPLIQSTPFQSQAHSRKTKIPRKY